MEEEGDRETRRSPAFAGRIHDPMSSGLEAVIGQALQHIPHIDYDLVGEGGDRHPFVLFGKDLEAVGGSAYEEGDQVDVFMLLGANSGFRLRFYRRVVAGPEDGIAIVDKAVEPMLVQTQEKGKKTTQDQK